MSGDIGRCIARNHWGERDGVEVCQDSYCRACHVSLTFEACVDGSWVDEQRRASGIPTDAERRAP